MFSTLVFTVKCFQGQRWLETCRDVHVSSSSPVREQIVNHTEVKTTLTGRDSVEGGKRGRVFPGISVEK